MRTVAEGNLKTFLLAILAIAVVLAAISGYPQLAQAYDVETNAKVVCNESIKKERFGGDADIDALFMQGARKAGVALKRNQYSMNVMHDKGRGLWICDVKVVYPVDVELFTIGPILGIPPYHFAKRFSFTHEVPDAY